MADRWFYTHDGQKIGPCSGQQLKEFAACGRILPTDTVWKEGIEKGSLAQKVRYLFPPAPVNAPPNRIANSPAKSVSQQPAALPAQTGASLNTKGYDGSGMDQKPRAPSTE